MISHNFNDIESSANKYLSFLDEIIGRQATLIAKWMLSGFIHGVMNTDNASIVGETIDYGPCAFLDEFNPQKVFSSIDRDGRYAWDQQPSIAFWNLTQLAVTLLPLIDPDQEKAEALVKTSLDKFVPAFQTTFHMGMRQKLGVSTTQSDQSVIEFTSITLTAMFENQIDFTVFFDLLTRNAMGEDVSDTAVLELFTSPRKAEVWLEQWQALRSDDVKQLRSMRQANPTLIARNHRVEEAIQAAVTNNDFEPFRRLCVALLDPYSISKEDRELQLPPRTEQLVTQTFCGT